MLICNDCANVTSAGTNRQKQLWLNEELLDCGGAGNPSTPMNGVEVSTAGRSSVIWNYESVARKPTAIASKNVREMAAHESDEHIGKVATILEICPTLQICEAAVRLSRMLMAPFILSLYFGSPVNCFQTGALLNPCQCFLCASRFSPQVR